MAAGIADQLAVNEVWAMTLAAPAVGAFNTFVFLTVESVALLPFTTFSSGLPSPSLFR